MISDFRHKLEAAAAYPEERFAAFLLSSDFLAVRLDEARRCEIIAASLACGQKVADGFRREHGGARPSKIAGMRGVKVGMADLPGHRMTLSIYEPERKEILLDRIALASLERAIEEHNLVDVFGPFSIAEIAVAHELFHHIEDGDGSIYSRGKIITLWRIGPFQYRSQLPAAGEMAAMACAKSLCRLSFNPLLLEAVLLQTSGAEHAAAWLERLNLLQERPSIRSAGEP